MAWVVTASRNEQMREVRRGYQAGDLFRLQPAFLCLHGCSSGKGCASTEHSLRLAILVDPRQITFWVRCNQQALTYWIEKERIYDVGQLGTKPIHQGIQGHD